MENNDAFLIETKLHGCLIGDDWDDYDHCYECDGYGDDYFINEDGELESACPTRPFNKALRRLSDELRNN